MTGSSEWPPNCLDVQNALGLPTSALERWFQFQLDRSGRTVSQPISLTELANKYGSDKGNAVRFRHDYTALYEPIFAPLRLHPIPLLEIGLAVSGPEGGSPIERVANAPSIAMWLQYFPHAAIYGFDMSDFSHVRHPRFRFIRGDLGSYDDLMRLAATAPSSTSLSMADRTPAIISNLR